jgi:hypothetical protein
VALLQSRIPATYTLIYISGFTVYEACDALVFEKLNINVRHEDPRCCSGQDAGRDDILL